LGVLQGVPTGLVTVLAGVIRNLMNVLSAYRDQKAESEGPDVAVATANESAAATAEPEAKATAEPEAEAAAEPEAEPTAEPEAKPEE
jgi:predicted lipid-binding transport protein (Tim44 family)